MSQDIFNDIDASSTSGTELADLLNLFKDAYASGNSGDTSRPTNLQANGYWIKYNNPDDGLLTWYLYDGTQDIELFQINKSTASIILTSSEDSFNIVKNSDDAIGPDLGLKKGRVAGGGQTVLNDVIGNIKWIGRDGSSTEFEQARITSVSLEDVESGAHGANIAFYTTQTGTSSLVKAITITNDKKLGVGVDAPTQMIETEATDSTAGFKATLLADSVTGPSISLKKKRVASSGQVLSGDTIGNFETLSTDDGGLEIDSAKIKSVAAENHTSTAGGTNLVIQRVKVGATVLSDAITIDNDGVTIHDNLTVSGTTTSIDTTNLVVEDKNITINDGGDDASSEGAGLTVERTGTDGSIVYEDALTSKFKVGALGSEVEVSTVSGAQTESNKTYHIGEAVALTSTSTELNQLDGVTVGGTSSGDIVDLDTAQDLTGKAIITPSRLDVKQDTKSNLETYAATAANGQFCFATDDKKMFQIVDNALTDVGGGVGNTETIKVLKGEDGVGNWGTTGLVNATFVQNTTTPLNGDADFKYGNITGSVNEIVWSEDIDVPLKSQNRMLGVNLAYTSDGADDDITVHLYDVTNSVYLGSESSVAGVGKRMLVTGFGNDTAKIKLGYEIEVVNNGTFFYSDDIEFTGNPIESVLIPQENNYSAIISSTGAITSQNKDAFASASKISAGIIEVVFTTGFFSQSPSIEVVPITTAARTVTVGNISSTGCRVYVVDTSGTAVDAAINIMVSNQGDDYNLTSEGVVHSDSVLGSHYVGSATWATTAGAQWVQSSTVGWADFATNASAPTPTVDGDVTVADEDLPAITISNAKPGRYVAIQTGGLPFPSAGTSNVSFRFHDGTNIWGGASALVYPQSTSIIRGEYTVTVAGAINLKMQGKATASANATMDNSTTDMGDFRIVVYYFPTSENAGRTVITPLTQTVYLKDLKTSGTMGGTFTSGAWQPRILNTASGDTSIVSLSNGTTGTDGTANKFTLGAGIYNIETKAPAEEVNAHQSRLAIDVDGSPTYVSGTSEMTNTTNQVTSSVVITQVTITAVTIFQLQHRCVNTNTADGFGNAAAFGIDEVYTQVKITKLKTI